MAKKKISGMDPANAPDGSELVEVVQVGVNKKATISQVRNFVVSTLTTSNIPEGSNLYFTPGRVLSTTLVGLSREDDAVTEDDTIIVSIGKLQGQIDDKQPAGNYFINGADNIITLDTAFNIEYDYSNEILVTQRLYAPSEAEIVYTGIEFDSLFGSLETRFIAVNSVNAARSVLTASSGGAITLFSDDNTGSNGFGFEISQDNGFLFTDNRSTAKGFQYAASGYVTQLHSLTDKEYVDTQVLGLQPAGNYLVLGVDNIGDNTFLMSADGDETSYFGNTFVTGSVNSYSIGLSTPDDSIDFTIGKEGGNINAILLDGRTTKRGFEYGGTGYVTQLHSLTDKEYVDTNLGLKMTNPMTLAGDMIVGGSSPAGTPTRLPIGANGTVLLVSGSSVAWSNISTFNITNGAVTYAKIQNVAGLSVVGNYTNSNAVSTAITGTVDQVLRVDSAGLILGFGSLDLSKSGTVGTSVLSIANGGTGSATQNFVDLTTAQTIAGKKSFTATTTNAAVNIGLVASPGVPSSLVDGDIWVNNVGLHLGFRIASTTSYAMRTNATAAGGAIPYVAASGSSFYNHSAGLAFNGTLFTTTSATIGSNSLTTSPLTLSYGGTTPSVNITLGLTTTGGVTIRNTGGEINAVIAVGNGVTTGAVNQTLRAIAFTSTYTANHTGATIQGFVHNPTIAGTQAGSVVNVAFAAQAGAQFVMGSLIPTAGLLMDLQSTTMAFRMPTMSTTQRNNISSPAEGFLVFNNVTHTLDFYNGTTWGPVSSGGGSVILSALTAATGTNSINNLDYTQTWSWNSYTGTNDGFTISSTSTVHASNGKGLFRVDVTGANANANQQRIAGIFTVSSTGTNSTNAAGYFNATGASSWNIGVWIANGNLMVNPSATSIVDLSNNELIKFVTTANAVNEFTVTNNATGNNPKFSATGGDANIGIDFLVKGTGLYRFIGSGVEVNIDSTGTIFIGNTTSVPASNPASGGRLYVESGALKYRGSGGTVTTIANA